MAEEAVRAMQQQFTTALADRPLTCPEQTASSERACSTQAGDTSSAAWVADDGSRCGYTAAGKAWRVLGCSSVARLECSVPVLRWRSGATTAEADGGSRESGSADAKRHDPGGRRTGSIGAALLDDAHDLQGRSSEHRVPDN